MKKNFTFALTGKDWWKPFIGFWVVYLILEVLQITARHWAPSAHLHLAVHMLIVTALAVVFLLVEAAFMIVFFRIFLPKLSIEGKYLGFRGSVGKFFGINVGGILLSIITVFVYGAWYLRRVVAYLVSESSFDDTAPAFLGKGGKLFVYLLLGLVVPIIVVLVLLGVLVVATGRASATSAWLQPVTTAVICLLIVPVEYLIYKWYVNIQWKENRISWETRFWKSIGFMYGQLLLTVVTVGIYWPAALLRVFRYFAGKTVLTKDQRKLGRFGFEGSIGKGFCLMWGQTLLSIITLGIYIPWAYAKVARWVAASSYYNEEA